MKSHLAEDIRIANPRFHHPARDGLYRPIAFMFVTEHMRDDILAERALLLASLPEVLRYVAGPLQAMTDGRLDSAILRQLQAALQHLCFRKIWLTLL